MQYCIASTAVMLKVYMLNVRGLGNAVGLVHVVCQSVCTYVQ